MSDTSWKHVGIIGRLWGIVALYLSKETLTDVVLVCSKTDQRLALFDTQIDSIQCLNFAQNWFNSIFNSKLFHENSIQKIIQFKIVSWKFNSKDYSIQNKSFWFNSIDYSIQNKALWFNSINYSIQ